VRVDRLGAQGCRNLGEKVDIGQVAQLVQYGMHTGGAHGLRHCRLR
jgi:hypothetical protein